MIILPILKLNDTEISKASYDETVNFSLALSSAIAQSLSVAAAVSFSSSISAGPTNIISQNAAVILQNIRTTSFAGNNFFNALLALDKALQIAQQTGAISSSNIVFAKIDLLSTTDGSSNDLDVTFNIGVGVNCTGTVAQTASIELSKLLEEIANANVAANANITLTKINVNEMLSQCIAYASIHTGYSVNVSCSNGRVNVVVTTPSERIIEIKFENRFVTLQ